MMTAKPPSKFNPERGKARPDDRYPQARTREGNMKQSAYSQGRIIVLNLIEEKKPHRAPALRAGTNAFVRKSEMSMSLTALILELVNYPAGNNKPKNLGLHPGAF